MADSYYPALKNKLQATKFSYNKWASPIADAVTDVKWGDSYLTSQAPHAYFDYYFTGQDINVFIEGVNEAGDIGKIPIMEFGFGIQQQKQPVYGFWSWTFDAVMRGTRVVNGMFRVVTKTPDYMAKLIAEAAQNRVSQTSVMIRDLDIDENLIQTYWTRNFNDNSTSQVQGLNLFGSHPPFNFVVVYGVQTPTVYDPTGANSELYDAYRDDTPLSTDINERLVEARPDQNNMRHIIESVEITGMQTEYTADGQPCSEVYSFFAQDMYSVNNNSNVLNVF